MPAYAMLYIILLYYTIGFKYILWYPAAGHMYTYVRVPFNTLWHGHVSTNQLTCSSLQGILWTVSTHTSNRRPHSTQWSLKHMQAMHTMSSIWHCIQFANAQYTNTVTVWCIQFGVLLSEYNHRYSNNYDTMNTVWLYVQFGTAQYIWHNDQCGVVTRMRPIIKNIILCTLLSLHAFCTVQLMAFGLLELFKITKSSVLYMWRRRCIINIFKEM